VHFDTDKVEPLGYLGAYLRLASQIGPAGRICEVGVYRGGSLDMWQALFPTGLIVGVDCSTSAHWPIGTVKIVAGQDDETLPNRLTEASDTGFDMIIEDASHDGKLSRRTWELLWPLVVPGGWYVLEDWMVGLDGWTTEDGWGFDDSMLITAQSFLRKLDSRDSDVESIEYRYGLAILHKRG